MAPVVAGQPDQSPSSAAPQAVTLTAVTQPLRPLAQTTALAPVQQLVPLQPQNPLGEQVGFHLAFVGDFISTGAVLFAREFAIPGVLLQDIQGGTPAPVAVSRALQTFAQIELEAGRELVGFAAEYVTFQLNFFASLATMPVAVVSAFATAASGGLAPAASPVAELTAAPRATKAVPSTSDDAVESVSTGKVSTTARATTERPKKPKTAVAAQDSVSATTDTDDTPDAAARATAHHTPTRQPQANSIARPTARRMTKRRATRRKAVATKAIRPDAAPARSPIHR